LAAEFLVPGDIVRLSLGVVVPADVKILEGSVLLDQSALTGESVPVEAGAGTTGYASALVRRGEAVALITATGASTCFGRTAELVNIAKVESSEVKAVLGLVRNLSIHYRFPFCNPRHPHAADSSRHRCHIVCGDRHVRFAVGPGQNHGFLPLASGIGRICKTSFFARDITCDWSEDLLLIIWIVRVNDSSGSWIFIAAGRCRIFAKTRATGCVLLSCHWQLSRRETLPLSSHSVMAPQSPLCLLQTSQDYFRFTANFRE
jgi:hypothetical protein